jgi:hypothetical protein
MEYNPSWETNRHSGSQEIPHPEPEDLLLCSQEPITGPYHKPDE